MRRLALVLLLAALAALNGCAYSAYGLYDDQRLMDTITDDKTLATSIKTALMNENFSGGWSIAVYSYYGNVFLVGEVPQNMQGKALAIARRYKPRSVTPHWFSPAKSDTSNFALAASLRTDLIGAKGLSSTRIDTEVNAGRVVLLGVVKDDEEKQIAIRTARKVKGVTSVTSYLMLPQRPGKAPAEADAQTGAQAGREGVGERELPPARTPAQQPAQATPPAQQPAQATPPAQPQAAPSQPVNI
ncbi:BON domain-containing protein [uncultured Desulfovibrio sp.]|uniref:BON domain-containing protein n=1 Tax=uncultured Desulfovibrio sp. TaxID=167968 RepID=UPI0026DB3281|nr:BON domain-containing protein [uncultured Desulfovibrio sp.]